MFYATSRGVLKHIPSLYLLLDVNSMNAMPLAKNTPWATCPESPYVVVGREIWEHFENGMFGRNEALTAAHGEWYDGVLAHAIMLTATHVYCADSGGIESRELKTGDKNSVLLSGELSCTDLDQLQLYANLPDGTHRYVMQTDGTWLVVEDENADVYAHDGVVWAQDEFKCVCFPYAIVHPGKLMAMLPGGKWLDCELKVSSQHFLYKKHDVVWLARAGTPQPGDEPPRALDFIEQADARKRWKSSE